MKELFSLRNKRRKVVKWNNKQNCAWIVMRSFGYDMQTNINYVGIWGLNQDNAVKYLIVYLVLLTFISAKKLSQKEQEKANMTESKKYLKENGIPSR